MYVLWAVRKENEDWQEEIITTNHEKATQARAWATANGFDRFREATFADDEKPDFRSTVSI